MSLAVTCDECGHLVSGAVHVRGTMRATAGQLRLVSPTVHYHWPCLLAWAARAAADERATAPMPAAR